MPRGRLRGLDDADCCRRADAAARQAAGVLAAQASLADRALRLEVQPQNWERAEVVRALERAWFAVEGVAEAPAGCC